VTDPISHFTSVIAEATGRFVSEAVAAVLITLHETVPVGSYRLVPLNPLQLKHPETVATVAIVKVNGVYPFLQVYPVKRLLLISTKPEHTLINELVLETIRAAEFLNEATFPQVIHLTYQ